MAAGDAQTSDTIHKGAKPVDQQSLSWADLHKQPSDKQPSDKQPSDTREGLTQSQSVDVMNRNKQIGKFHDGTYGEVAPGFQVNGVRPQDSLPASQPGQATSDWDKQKAAGQARLDALAAQNQQQVAETTKAIGTPAKGNGDRPDNVHYLGIANMYEAAGLTAAYAKFGHPLVQKPLIALQLKADDRAAMGKQGPISKLISMPRKYYLEQFSPVYEAQSQLAKIVPQEEAARKSLTALKQVADEKVEALSMKAADVKDLRKLAATTPTSTTTAAELEQIAKAERQVKIIDAVGKTAPARRAALTAAQSQAQFLADNSEYLATKANPGTLNWEGFSKAMDNSKAFSAAEMKSAADMAAADKAIFAIGGKEMTRTEMQALVKSAESSSGMPWKAAGTRFLGAAAFVGVESFAQGWAGEQLHQNGHDMLGRWIEPNTPGVVAKTASIMLAPTWAGKGRNLLASQLLEAETNMTRLERFTTVGTIGVGAGVTKLLADANNMPVVSKYAKTALLLDLGIGLLAEGAHDLLYKDDHALNDTGSAIKNAQSNPNDYSHSSLRDKVQELADQGKKDPFLMTQIYDTTTSSPNLKITNADNTEVAAYKSKQLMIVQQAQGETILANGMSKSQYLKMQDPSAPITDNQDHQEEWRLGVGTQLDIASQGSRALIQALGSANLTEAFLAAQGKNDAANQVDKQRKDIKQELDQVFDASHARDIVAALNKDSWLSQGTNSYNLPLFWNHNNSDYDHMYHMVLDKANKNQALLATHQANLQAEQQRLQQAQAAGDQAKIAMETKFVQAREDAVKYNTAYTAKLYRDAAFLKLGQTQSMFNVNAEGKVVNTDDLNGQLQLAEQALQGAAALAQNNADLQQLQSIYTSMTQKAATISTPNYQPNH